MKSIRLQASTSSTLLAPVGRGRRVAIPSAVAIALGAIAAQPALAQSQPGSDQQSSAIQAGPVTINLGGFTELATIYRNRNEVSDVGSDFNTGIPFNNNVLSQESEFRESARQSRFSLLAQGDPYAGARAELYMETDFLSAGVTSNSRESNSYTLRVRHFYGRFITDSGLDITAGQTWSYATLAKDASMAPRDQITPLTIDAQYVVGFNWTRNPQLRVVQEFGKEFSLGFSLESPQTVTSNGINSADLPAGVTFPAASTNYQNSGDSAGLENSTTTYTADTRPDVIVKAAADPGWGHYEIYGLARWFTSSIVRQSNTVGGGGVGVGMILPLVPDVLKFQLSGLYGRGIGRYGSAQLPDVTMKPNGELSPIPMYQILLGLTLTPDSNNTVYFYFGREQANSTYYNLDGGVYGYGAPEFNNSGCYATTGTCVGNTHSVEEVTGGYWMKFYHGKLGNAQFGLQAEYLQRQAFPGLGPEGEVGFAPIANIFIGMASFRYYPYQH